MTEEKKIVLSIKRSKRRNWFKDKTSKDIQFTRFTFEWVELQSERKDKNIIQFKDQPKGSYNTIHILDSLLVYEHNKPTP